MNRKNWQYYWLRNPRTTQERRETASETDWKDEFGKIRIRGKRCSHNLPNAYDDIPFHKQKSWKKKRKEKYHASKGKQYSITIFFESKWSWNDPHYARFRKIQNYLENHGIPHRIEDLRQVEIRWSDTYHRYFPSRKWIGGRIVWWSDKDIGIDFI